MKSNDNFDEDKPLSPEAERISRKVSRYGSAVMGFNLVALLFLLGVIVYKLFSYANSKDETIQADAISSEGAGFERTLDLPDGVEILSASQQGQQILLNLKFENGDAAIWIYNISEDRITGKLSIN